jgi:hypothetical protein
MRWDALFADLEGQVAALASAERAAEVEERTRGEVGRLATLDRMRAAVGAPLRLRLAGNHAASGTLLRLGADWLLLDEGSGREVLIVVEHLVGVRGIGRYSAARQTAGAVASRLQLPHVLRGLARDRSAVRVHLVDGSTVDGTVDRVGADFIDLAAPPTGEPRRRQDVRDVELLRLPAVAAVRRGS